MYKKIKKIHIIGIGGIGMSGIAELLYRHGYHVSGSDLHRNDNIRHLEQLGILVKIGHESANVQGKELVVFSSAILPTNSELRQAREDRIPVISRAEMLAELMRLKTGIAVAGAHGKTTTTSMTALLLTQGGLDPTIVVGGRMDNFGGTNARMGGGEFMVVEADESDGTFNYLSSAIAVVTNIDREHMDHFGSMKKLRRSFIQFLNHVPFYGLNVVCGDDPYIRKILRYLSRRKVTYGFLPQNDYRVLNYKPSEQGSLSQVEYRGEPFELYLRVPGRHNCLNALAALAIADEVGLGREKSLGHLSEFQGVQRRFQVRGQKNGVTFVDDYAHHPSEIQSTLQAARERYPSSKIRVVFQPHRYSRVIDLFDQFAKSFERCDAIALTDIYAAGEKSDGQLHSGLLVEEISRTGHPQAVHINKAAEAIDRWLGESSPGDVILTLGAGDLPNVYRDLF